jgi:hypothetical protein
MALLLVLGVLLGQCKGGLTNEAGLEVHDLDADGHVNKTEFHKALRLHKHDHTPGEAREAFEKADKNIDGKLTLSELKISLGQEAANSLKRKMDRYLWPLGLLACPLLWTNAAYFTVQIIVKDDMSSLTIGSALLSACGGVLLILSFQNGWDNVVDLAGFITVAFLCLYLPPMAWREFTGRHLPSRAKLD